MSANDPIADDQNARYCKVMNRHEAKFRPSIAYAMALAWPAAPILFYALPHTTGGRMSGVIRTEHGFTALGMLCFSISCVFTALSLHSALRAALRLPALSSDGAILHEHIAPFRRFHLKEIERFDQILADDVALILKSGEKRRINVRLIEDPEAFFSRITLS